MKKSFKRTLSLLLALTLLLSTAAILPVSAKGGEWGEGHTMVSNQRYAVVAECGVITPKYGKLEDGKAKGGSVMTVTLDESACAGHTFAYWKSAYGDKVPDKTFEVYIDRDVYFYPVFSDVKGGFGAWEFLAVGDCSLGDIYVRTHSEYGFRQFKAKQYHYGEHDWHYTFVDADTCRAVCSHCGFTCDEEHWFDEGTVLTPPTEDHDGVIAYTCEKCGGEVRETIDASEAPAHEHSWVTYDAEIIREAKDGQPGIRRVHCADCGAEQDVWYIKAEWEKYYFGSRIYFDVSDSSGLWGTDDELHYSFVNDEGYDTYVYAVREDYRDNYQAWAFMWIDHADSLGRKPLYLAKSSGQNEAGTASYPAFGWAIVGYLDTVEDFISEIDFITCGYDRYSSGLFDMFKAYEKLYNDGMFPADSSPDFLDHYPYWEYENGDASICKDANTGIGYYSLRWNDGRQTLHIDPETNVCISNFEPNASSRHSYLKSISAIVSPDAYQAISDAFVPESFTYPVIEYPEVQEREEGHTHTADIWDESVWLAEDSTYHVAFCECGEPIRRTHSLSYDYDFDLDDPLTSHVKGVCGCGYIWEDTVNVFPTSGISDEIYNTFRNKHWLTKLSVNVLTTPAAVNFQLRVNPCYTAEGPLKDDSRFEWHGSTVPWTYGYYSSDWSSYGVVRTEATPYDYWNHGGPDRYSVTLKYTEYDNYTFDRWEIYDWATGEWVFFSDEKTPTFNVVSYEVENYTYGPAQDAVFTSDSRLMDQTFLRCVRTYHAPEPVAPAHITVTGGVCYPSDGCYDDAVSELEVPAGTMVYLEYDEDMVPAGKRFLGWNEVKDGEVLCEGAGFYGVTVESGVYEFIAVYEDAAYYVNAYAENGYVYPAGDSGNTAVGGVIGHDTPSGSIGDLYNNEREEFCGGEYPYGAVLTLTTEGEEGYDYFYGWYEVTYEEKGEEFEFITAEKDITFTVTGDCWYVAKWGDTAVMPEEPCRVIRVTDGFASVRQYREGLYLSCVCAPYYSSVTFMDDPGAFLDVEMWRLAGTFDDSSEYLIEEDGGWYEFWFGDEYDAPALIEAAPVGSANLLFADSDGDGDININDATRIQRVLAAIDDDTYGRADLVCDLSGNGTVDIVDATLIQRYLAGYEVPNQEKIGEQIGLSK